MFICVHVCYVYIIMCFDVFCGVSVCTVVPISMCSALHRGEVDEQVWRFLLTGGVALENPHPNPFPQWLTDKSWGEIVRASDLENLKGLMKGDYAFY